MSGSGGVLGGKVMGEDSAHAGGAQSVMQKQSPPSPNSTKAMASGSTQGGAGGTGESASASSSAQDGEFAHAAEAIRQSVQDNPDLANLSHQLILEQTPQGMRIQLVDQDGRPMFQNGSNEPLPYTKKLLAAVGSIIAGLPNRVSIAGHTGGNDSAANGGSWELSASRANQARALLQAGGLGSDRIYEVAGKAGSEPLLPEDPNASANAMRTVRRRRELRLHHPRLRVHFIDLARRRHRYPQEAVPPLLPMRARPRSLAAQRIPRLKAAHRFRRRRLRSRHRFRQRTAPRRRVARHLINHARPRREVPLQRLPRPRVHPHNLPAVRRPDPQTAPVKRNPARLIRLRLKRPDHPAILITNQRSPAPRRLVHNPQSLVGRLQAIRMRIRRLEHHRRLPHFPDRQFC